jgi:peptidoglycan/xylan/chitin deacetylase (PgdA/CDA1 family)
MIPPKARGLRTRIKGYCQRKSAYLLATRKVFWTYNYPVVSFTFDDFPRSAFLIGGRILEDYGCRGTYFASLGLEGNSSPSGELFSRVNLEELLARGHEVGCHTFDHADAWKTTPRRFREAIHKNREALSAIAPGYGFRSLAYPLTEPRPRIKRIAQEYFSCCRGGGRMLNGGWLDLNLLKSFFIDRKNRGDQDFFERLIEKNRVDKSWLIFSTHDVSENASDYGCSPEQFEKLVRRAVDSGAEILPLAKVVSCLSAATPGRQAATVP